MKMKLNCIMLIDDNPGDNRYHQIVIEGMNITDRIEIALDGMEALNILKNKIAPDLIFLDINMPKMNGWEFLEAYKKLGLEEKAKIIIVMLTTSENPKDYKKTEQIKEVSGFYVKPLTEENMTKILEQHFSFYQ